MSNIFKVSSLPLKDVIKDLSGELKTDFTEKCTEYIVTVPDAYGEGEIRGINFINGLGIIIYRCKFNSDTEIQFTCDRIHPVKYMYACEGPITHSFSDETIKHKVTKNKCAIVASENTSGHVLYFDANKPVYMVSLEINREKFLKNTECYIENLSKPLQDLFSDVNATKRFYHEGYYSVNFYKILNSITAYEDKLLLRKLHLESNALNIFVNQIRLYEDDIKSVSNRTILRNNELIRIEELGKFIDDNLGNNFSIEELSKHSGLNPNKLQFGFKYVYNKTVREYIILKRLEYSKDLLCTTDLSINAIANKIGVESASYFSKLFKNHYGLTPSEFKKTL